MNSPALTTPAIVYGPTRTIVILPEDSAPEVRLVMLTKLRRNESFLVSTVNGTSREDIWIHPAIPLSFVGDFSRSASPGLTRSLIDEANRGTLLLPAATAHPADQPTIPLAQAA